MEDDDDEVVLQNSALYIHLLKNGLNDFESAKIPKPDSFGSPLEVLDQSETKSLDIPENADNLDKFINIMLNSNLIFHDDVIIVRNFTTIYQKSSSLVKSWCFKLILQFSITSSVCLFCSFRRFKPKPLAYVSLSLTPLVMFIVKRLHRAYIEFADRTRINEMIKNMKDLSMMLHKCIKFIQESEVLTYYSVNQSKVKSSFRILSGNDDCSTQIMFQLRHAVYSTLQTIILNLKITICSLLRNFPIKKSADSMNFYLACLNDEELHCSRKEKNTITVDDLLKMKYIYLLLQSEFLKRLCLNMNPFLCLDRVRKDDLLNFVDTIGSSCARLHSQIKDVFHIFYILEKLDECKTTQNADWIYKEAYVKICSVSHNLQSLLKKSRHIEEYLESTRLQNSDHDKVISMLDAFSEELVQNYEHSKSVIKDFHNYVLRQKPRLSNDDLSPVVPSNEETDATPKIVPSVGKSDFRPPCPDEIFIGVSTEEKKPEDENPDEDFIVTKKCSKLLISELKLALKDKAQEWRERERVALQNKNLVDEDDVELTEEETSSSDERNDLKTNRKRSNQYNSETSEDESDFNEKLSICAFPTQASFAEKIAFASSKWGLKSEEFVGNSENDQIEK